MEWRWWWTTTQKSEEPCKKIACDFQACLKKNFDPKRCAKVIESLQLCCEIYNYESTHCVPLPDLLKLSSKRFNAKTRA